MSATEDIASPVSEEEAVEFKPKLRRRSLTRRKKLCPNCLSELHIATSVSGWLVPNYYFCSKCGYSGYVALEEMPKEKK
ncbi:MAG: hypothetical protein OK439_03110 [Thaumarchaeota archaeon]|nr:hypothetical protein [Nitrososphaerota archaeon]